MSYFLLPFVARNGKHLEIDTTHQPNLLVHCVNPNFTSNKPQKSKAKILDQKFLLPSVWLGQRLTHNFTTIPYRLYGLYEIQNLAQIIVRNALKLCMSTYKTTHLRLPLQSMDKTRQFQAKTPMSYLDISFQPLNVTTLSRVRCLYLMSITDI